MAEVLATIAIVTEGAKMVKEVIGALQAAKNLIDSFSKQPNRNKEVVAAIERAKQEIISRIDLAELKSHQETLFLVSYFWYQEALPKLSKYPISKESIENRSQLFDIDRQINTKKDQILGVIFFLHDGRNNLPKTPVMMSMYLAAHHLLISILTLHRALLADPNSSAGPDTSANIAQGVVQALEGTKAFCEGYQSTRLSQIKGVLRPDGDALHVKVFHVTEDIGGDEIIPKFQAGYRTEFRNQIVRRAWSGGEIGKVRLPALYAEWEDLRTRSAAFQ